MEKKGRWSEWSVCTVEGLKVVSSQMSQKQINRTPERRKIGEWKGAGGGLSGLCALSGLRAVSSVRQASCRLYANRTPERHMLIQMSINAALL
jgi:hypothetical protein